MLFADNFRRERFRSRGERIDRRINSELGDGTLEHDGRIEVRERVRRRRIGQIVRRNVNRLERSDRAFLGRSDSLLQIAHLRGERRLITDGGRRAAEQRRNFRTGLRKTKDVVDEEQHVLVAFVAEIFRHRQRGERHAQTRAGRLVHLPVNERDLRFAQSF